MGAGFTHAFGIQRMDVRGGSSSFVVIIIPGSIHT
jgi:hypothetical protein